MATELVPHLWDDVDLAADPPRKTPASGTVTLMFGDSGAREIDLTAEHAMVLRAAMEPFLAASRPVHHPKENVAPQRRTRKSRSMYLTGLREWAGQQGIEVERYYAPDGTSAGFKYPVELQRKYDAWLREHPAAATPGS